LDYAETLNPAVSAAFFNNISLPLSCDST